MVVCHGFVRSRLLLACATAALLLTGCDQHDAQKSVSENTQAATIAPPLAALPLSTGAAPANAPAPTASELPPASPLRYVSLAGDRYAYLDRAYALDRAFGDAPPDYTYDYDRQQPMIWRSDDGYVRVAEDLPDGRIRYCYYQPGADRPYFIQDPDYGYGYSDDALVIVYDANGNILDDAAAQRQADIAARYLARAEALYAASLRERHEAVAQAAWDRQRERIYDDEQRWRTQQDRNAAWHAYHDAHAQEEQAHWAMERYRRAAEAARFAQAVQDAAVTARATQALADATAEARRYGQNVGSSGPSQAPRHVLPADPNPHPLDRRAPPPANPAAHPIANDPRGPHAPDTQRAAPPAGRPPMASPAPASVAPAGHRPAPPPTMPRPTPSNPVPNAPRMQAKPPAPAPMTARPAVLPPAPRAESPHRAAPPVERGATPIAPPPNAPRIERNPAPNGAPRPMKEIPVPHPGPPPAPHMKRPPTPAPAPVAAPPKAEPISPPASRPAEHPKPPAETGPDKKKDEKKTP